MFESITVLVAKLPVYRKILHAAERPGRGGGRYGEADPKNKHGHAKSDTDRSFQKSNLCKWLKE